MKKHLRSPLVIKSQLYVHKSLLRQVYYGVKTHEKFSLLVHLIKQHPDGLSLVFCATRHEVDLVTQNLKQNDIKVMAIHGGLTQNRRLQALEALKNEHISVLVATDVAARGLDIKNVSHVYNYDVPKSSEEYVHRIGRTARAGMEGDAITLLAERDHSNFNSVLRDHTLEIKSERLPEFARVPFNRVSEERREHRGGGFRRGGQGGGRGFGGGRGGSRSSGFSSGRGEGSSGGSKFGGQRPQRRPFHQRSQ